MATTKDDTAPEPIGTGAIPVLLSISNLVELFGVAKHTAYRWNAETQDRGRQLPVPDLVVGDKLPTPLWRESVILEWAEATGRQIDMKVLRRIRKAQGHG